MIRRRNPYAKAAVPEEKAPSRRVSPAKVLLVAVAANFMFLGAYLSLDALSASAADDKAAQAAPVRREPAQDMRTQLDSLKQREELLRVRQRELQLLEARIDGKIKRLSELETNVKAEIAMYRGITDERTKHLVKIYSSMKPNAAATLMNQMDIEVATEVFLSMKGEVAGGILAYMEPAKAAAITKRLMSSRKLNPSTSQAGPFPAGQLASAEIPGAAPAEPVTALQTASVPVESQAPKARARAKAKRWTPAAKGAPQTGSLATIPRTDPSMSAPAAAPASVQAAPPPAAPQSAPHTQAPQASAPQTAAKPASQALAQSATAQAGQQ